MSDIASLSVTFDNAHGGTYIAHCSVSYYVPGSSEPQTLKGTASGGLLWIARDIPVTAVNLSIEVDFVAGTNVGYTFFNPAQSPSWPDGNCTIDLYGGWPYPATALIRVPT